MKTVKDLKKSYENGDYDEYSAGKEKRLMPNKVIDENKSVKWNREKVEQLNKEIDERNKMRQKFSQKELDDKFEKDLIEAFVNKTGLNEKQIKEIYYKVYGEYSFINKWQIILDVEELSEFVVELKNLNNE